jgi:hypothetical protein
LPCEYAEEENFDETHLIKDLITKRLLMKMKASVFSPQFDEVIQASIPPAHEEENMVSYTPFQVLMFLHFMIQKVKKC